MRKPSHFLEAGTGVQRLWTDRSGRVHRHGGPAIECEDGDKAWYTHGIYDVGQGGLTWGGLGLPELPGYHSLPGYGRTFQDDRNQ